MIDLDKLLEQIQKDINHARLAAYGRAIFIQLFGPERGPEKQKELKAKLMQAARKIKEERQCLNFL